MVHLSGEVGYDITLANIISHIEKGETDFTITTYGGDLFEGIAIRDYLKKTNAIKSLGALGVVASAGTIIMQGVKDIWTPKSTKFLIHNPQGGVYGDADAMLKAGIATKEMESDLINSYVEITNKTPEFIASLMKEERFLTAKEALDLKLINRIVELNNKFMNKPEKFELFNSLLSSAKSLLGLNNLVVQSTDGTELDFGTEIETIEQVQVGTPCTPDGSFVMPDGKTIVVSGGVVTEIVLPMAVEDAKDEEIANLKAKIEELTNSIAEKTNVIDSFKPIVKELETLKNSFSTDKPVGAVAPSVVNSGKSTLTITRKN